jgi:endothelin-converting enzyme
MSEKQPLIPIAASGGNVPRAHSKCKGRAIGRLLAATAAAGLIYYGMPYSMFHNSPWCLEKLTRLAGDSVNVDKAELCLTPACVHAASELLYNLAPNYKELDPCDNFEELVCGGWREKHGEEHRLKSSRA